MCNNAQTNCVFRRVHKLLEDSDTVLITRYVNTTKNPTDGPSRGIYPLKLLLLPPVKLPDEAKPFIVNFNTPFQPNEQSTSQHIHPEPKMVLPPAEHHRRHQANTAGSTKQTPTQKNGQTPRSTSSSQKALWAFTQHSTLNNSLDLVQYSKYYLTDCHQCISTQLSHSNSQRMDKLRKVNTSKLV